VKIAQIPTESNCNT